MSKKVLALYYTQSGQLEKMMDNFTAPFINAGMQVEKIQVIPKKDYPFPWTSDSFFSEMPESVLQIPTDLTGIVFKETFYDLIIFGYQPWFLSPSIPATSLLAHPGFQSVVKNTPVVTLIGARNMWLNAQEAVKKKLDQLGAKRVGNVVLTDRNNNILSAVSILYWMLSGKKERYLNIFPRPGVSEKDISDAGVFGETVRRHLESNEWQNLQPFLIDQKALEVKSDLMFIESRAGKLFSIWANLIIKKKNRRPWIILFKYYLLIALFIIAPVVLTINGILFKPFFKRQIERKKKYYLELN